MSFARNGKPRTSSLISTLSPVGGINDVDPIAAMDPKYSLQLVNWVPTPTALVTRDGYAEWVTGLDGGVRTLMNYAALDGTEKIFAATPTTIYDVTTSTATPVAAYSAAAAYWNYAQLVNSGVSFLVAAGKNSGAPIFYNGSTWSIFTQVPSPAAPGEVTGVDPALLSHVTVYKHRLWFVQQDSMTAWYLPTDAVGGELKPFYLGGVFKRGGYLYEIAVWSVSAGDGLRNKIVFRSSMGEVAVYDGDDPQATIGEVGAFSLDGVYYVSPPVGARSSTLLGGDLLLLTRVGIVSMNSLVSGELERSEYDNALTRNISRTLSQLVAEGGSEQWELDSVARTNQILLTMPATATRAAMQYSMNTLNGGWSVFDWPTAAFGQSISQLFFGAANGTVYRVSALSKDNVRLDGSGGVAIQAYVFSAFSYLDAPTVLKSLKFVRPFLQSDVTNILFALQTRVDFELTPLSIAPDDPGFVVTSHLWDDALWDNAVWSELDTTITPWVGVSGLGYSAAILMRIATDSKVRFSAFQLVYDAGGGV